MIANFAYALLILAAGAALAIAGLSAPSVWDRWIERRDQRTEETTTAEHRLVPERHVGATEEGTGMIEAEEDLLGIWAVPLWESRPSIFDDLARRTPVRLDWEPDSFTSSWTREDLTRILAEVSA